jgi:serine/threonine protein kinase
VQLKKIGRGGFGSVYKVQNVVDESFYAVKKINLKMKANKEMFKEELEKVLREVRTLASIKHSNIIGYN